MRTMAVDVAITRAHGVRLHFGEAVKLKDGWRFLERPSETVTKRRHTASGDTVEDKDLGE